MSHNSRSRPLRFADCSLRTQQRFMRIRRESLLRRTDNEETINSFGSVSDNEIDAVSRSSPVNDENIETMSLDSSSENVTGHNDENYESEMDRMSLDHEEDLPPELDVPNIADEEEDYDEDILPDTENFHSTHTGNDEEDPLLYANAPITQGESLLAILSFCLRHKLTGVAVEDLLKLIGLHCIQPNYCFKSMYHYRKRILSMNSVEPAKHFYCSSCLCHLNENHQCEECPPNSGISFFMELSIVDQLNTLYKRDGFIEMLKHRDYRNKIVASNYEDIYDGKVYQEVHQYPNITTNHHKLTFTWNCDGVSVFKSSKFQIWPFFLSINELPYSERFKKGNLLLAGLWFGHKKPLPPLFLKSISDELVELKNGIFVNIPHSDAHDSMTYRIKVQVAVICGTCDLPAKALMLNMKQYNGVYGCQKCKIKTELAEPRSNVRIYPYIVNLPLRSQEETNECARQAAELSNFDILGIKGPSVLVSFVPEYIRRTAVDVMHCAYLGVVKSLLVLWFHSNFSNENWSMHNRIAIINRKLYSITPPDFIIRLPRSISDHLPYFKASELKAWFFYYSLPILHSTMDEMYFEHYKLLVHGVYLLNQKSVSDEQVNTAERLLTEFVSRFSDLYSNRHMTANIHNLLHLAETVRDFGPLWVTSCFSYENANGNLRTLVTGTRFAETQICSGVATFMNLPNLKHKILIPNTPTYEFCEYLSKKKAKYREEHISGRIYIVGVTKEIDIMPQIIDVTLQEQNIAYTDIKMFLRLMKSGILYTSELYGRLKKTNSRYVKFIHNRETHFGKIYCFVKTSNCSCQSGSCTDECNLICYAIVNVCNVQPRFYPIRDINFTYVYECIDTQRTLAVNVEDLNSVCIHVDVGCNTEKYIVEPVNMIEVE